jgi:hypothetical protein
VRIVRLSTIALLEQNLRTKNTSQRPRLAAEESLRVFCQLLQLSKSFGPRVPPESVPRLAERSNFSNRNKKPGVERRANPPAYSAQAASRDARFAIIRYS